MIDTVILDEADKMLSFGFAEQLDKIKDELKRRGCILPAEKAAICESQFDSDDEDGLHQRDIQVGLYSATNPKSVAQMSRMWCGKPKMIHLQDKSTEIPNSIDKTSTQNQIDGKVSSNVVQVVHVCAEHKKLSKLQKHLASIDEISKTERHKPRILIFANRIKTVKYIAKELKKDSRKVTELHGEKSQTEREQAIADFKSGKFNILVASDVASRGLHIKNLPYVVNFDFPSNLETYIHRIGRTGRVDSSGHAYSFLTRSMAPICEPLVQFLDSHNQSIDPNLIKLAGSYKIAVEKMQEESKDGAPAQKPDLRSDAEKKRRQKSIRKSQNTVDDENEVKIKVEVKSRAPSPHTDTAKKNSKLKPLPLLPGKIKRQQRQMDLMDSDSDQEDDGPSRSPTAGKIKRRGKSLPGRLRKKLAKQRNKQQL